MKAVQSLGDRPDVGSVVGEVVDLFEVRAEEPFVCVTRPLRQVSDLARAERCDLAVNVEAGAVSCRSCETETDEPLERVREATVFARAVAETERLRQRAGFDFGGYSLLPQCGKPP